MRAAILFVTVLFLSGATSAQKYIIKGKVTDGESGEGMPFVNVYFKKTFQAVTTDFEGHYTMITENPMDSLFVSYVGYDAKGRPVKKIPEQVINFQLFPASTGIAAIEIMAGENPAFEVMRNVIANKDKNDKRQLDFYQSETYTKIEIDVDNMSDKFRQKKALRPITKIFDSLQLIAGDEGKPVLPVFFSESISDFFVQNSPKRTKEIVKASKVTGIGMDDGTFLTQIIGPTFQEYNFYNNWLNILDKDFVSPLAAGWKGYYDYWLMDSMWIDGYFCYKIDVEPKRPQDLAFKGTIWIDKATWALKQIDVMVGKEANLNYIEKIKIQQQLEKTSAGPWLPIRNRVLIDVAELNENWAGMISKFYTSSAKIEVNIPKPVTFFDDPIEVSENVLVNDEKFWQERRHDTLTSTEVAVFEMIDSIRNIPLVKTYVDILNFVINGHQRIGNNLEIGPYLSLYQYNTIEGHRFRLGGRTTIDFSRKLMFNGYVAYGTLDKEFKYKGEFRFIPSKKPWTEMSLSYKKDIEQLGILHSNLSENSLFAMFSRWGALKQPFMLTTAKAYFSRDIYKGFSQSVSFRNLNFSPRYNFSYFYRNEEGARELRENLNTSELTIETRYANRESFLYFDNERISMGTKKWPIFTATYTLGMKDILNSQYNYHKAQLGITQNVRMGSFGTTYYTATIGKIFNELPYPLLNVHLGNETPFFNSNAFNLMNYFEFVTDQYITFKYAHHFEGQLLNRIPLMRKLKWRSLVNADILYGTITDRNLNLIPPRDIDGEPQQLFYQLQGYKPYIEIGYGIENIFKVFRIEAFHRLTYYTNPGANKFGIKAAVQFKL